MKKWVAALLLLPWLLCAQGQAVEIRCVQENVAGGQGEGWHVMQALLDNGQEVYYLARETEGYFRMEDVNFDGAADFLPVSVLGARNEFVYLYLFDSERGEYIAVPHEGQGLCNLMLFPEQGYITSTQSDGYRDGIKEIYRWEGKSLRLLRRAECGDAREQTWDETRYMQTTDYSQCDMTVWDYTGAQEQGEMTYFARYAHDDPQEDAHLALLDEALWAGL